MASPGNQHYVNCIGALSFPILAIMARCLCLSCPDGSSWFLVWWMVIFFRLLHCIVRKFGSLQNKSILPLEFCSKL